MQFTDQEWGSEADGTRTSVASLLGELSRQCSGAGVVFLIPSVTNQIYLRRTVKLCHLMVVHILNLSIRSFKSRRFVSQRFY